MGGWGSIFLFRCFFFSPISRRRVEMSALRLFFGEASSNALDVSRSRFSPRACARIDTARWSRQRDTERAREGARKRKFFLLFVDGLSLSLGVSACATRTNKREKKVSERKKERKNLDPDRKKERKNMKKIITQKKTHTRVPASEKTELLLSRLYRNESIVKKIITIKSSSETEGETGEKKN